MFGLFLVLCMSGEPQCYEPVGYVYPDEENCRRDIDINFNRVDYTCLPIEGIYRAEDIDRFRAEMEAEANEIY